jgi:hypothetical protein
VSDRRKAALIDRALVGLFRSLEARPTPEHVLRTVDILQKADSDEESVSGATQVRKFKKRQHVAGMI